MRAALHNVLRSACFGGMKILVVWFRGYAASFFAGHLENNTFLWRLIEVSNRGFQWASKFWMLSMHLENWTKSEWETIRKGNSKETKIRVNNNLAKWETKEWSLHNSYMKKLEEKPEMDWSARACKGLRKQELEVKRRRAQGECLGIRSRWRTW